MVSDHFITVNIKKARLMRLFLDLQYASLAHFVLAKSLDCDRAQAETSLAGAPHHMRYP